MTNTQIPSYSGVTINIANPTVNAIPYQNGYQNPVVNQPQITEVTNPIQQAAIPQADVQQQIPSEQLPQAYPASYYMNNYNYQQNGGNNTAPVSPTPQTTDNTAENVLAKEPAEEDMSTSTEIINNLDAKAAKQKELEENGKQTRVVALTDEYIMSLENYLNNQNTDIRLMAAKEVLTRLDEDKTRYDDAALNALLNKMLQDPQKIIRVAALSALSSGLASGNDYTVQLLNNIQQNPNSDKEDVVEAANILLKMSADTKVIYQQKNENAVTQQQKKIQQQLIAQQKFIESQMQKQKDKTQE